MSNPFDEPGLARGYEAWYSGRGRRADRLEKQLLGTLRARFPRGGTVLDIGCGTGHFTRWLAGQGMQATGLDLSPAMLAEAAKFNGLRYLHGDVSALPFADRTFDLVAMVTTLEFVGDPPVALREAVRVARRGLILGVLNRHSLFALRRSRFAKPPWDSARLFSVGELTALVREAATGRLPTIRWRTTLWPVPGLGGLPLPFGSFIGLTASLRVT
ncbi:MAG TPA: class I SAM-dependent methyltransferase [Verrucomicrobiae bacterium]|nr:class I SAM-dependent methyltransferase [Verrucomicrobiae bacterium]